MPVVININTLFDQLGLDDSDHAIEEFVEAHKLVPANLKIHQADFWNASQAAFLQQAIEQDADWAEVVDQLDAMLR